MDIRELVNDKRRATLVGVAAGMIVIAAVILLRSSNVAVGSGGIVQRFFTVDDGKSTFTSPAASIPPFDYKGQQAVRAQVFECDGKRFVAYLERYTPEAQAALKQYETTLKSGKPAPPEQVAAIGKAETMGVEVKRPGEKAWSPKLSGPGAAALQVKCPSGGSGEPTAVEP